MKKNVILSALTVLLCMITTKAIAYDFAVENADGVTIYYNFINDGREVEITSGSELYFGKINIPETVIHDGKTLDVKRIGDRAFFYCFGLTAVSISYSVISIGYYAFAGCDNLTSVIIPNCVESIADYAFYDCRDLTSVVISNSVTNIGDSAFAGCIGLTFVISLIEEPFTINKRTFYRINNDATLYIPKNTKKTYETAGWAEYFNRIVEFDAVGINEIKPDRAAVSNAIYSLNGACVEHPAKGIYVKKGKKLLFR